MKKLDEIIIHHPSLDRGRHLFRSGDPFTSIYAVRSGCLKTYLVTKAGKEHIGDFHLPGEIVGLDAIDAGFYTSSAQVLQSCGVCEIPFARFEEAFADAPALQTRLLRIMSREIHNDRWMTMHAKAPAGERLAAFLCDLSHRFAQRGYSAHEFNLGMPRHDIGDYLGLTEETVCRMFTRLQNEQLLTAQGKHVRIHKLRELYRLAGIMRIPAYVP